MADNRQRLHPETSTGSGGIADPEQIIEIVRDAARRIREQVQKAIIGQEEVVEQVCTVLFCRGHALLVGVPGLAKTLLVSTVARALSLEFSRIQFTPDLMPSDITGTEVIEEDKATGKRQLRYVRGPVFANVILADEINRASPKTQSALLEAMQEHQVTVSGERHRLPQPFFVLATQNPIEQEGTYPLPEAQLDRFQFMIRVGYPTEEDELEVVKKTTAPHQDHVEEVLSAEEVLRIQEIVKAVPVADHVARCALSMVRATRRPELATTDVRPDYVRKYVLWGAGPRASQYLVLSAKAQALLAGRTHVTLDDIRSVAHAVLRHRLILNFNAEADRVRVDDLIDQLLESLETPSKEVAARAEVASVFRG